MPTWGDLATFATVVGLAGAAIDSLMLGRQKALIHRRLVQWWKRLDRTRVPDLHAVVAERMLQRIRLLFGPRLSALLFAKAAAVSWLLTTVAGDVGVWAQGLAQEPGRGYRVYTPELYVVNFIFDFATVAAAVLVLRHIAHSSAGRAMFVLAMSLPIVVALAVGSAVAVTHRLRSK